jgi:hypothetical protein
LGNPYHKAGRRINRFGLTRDIPDPIEREVRQRCGFGCVICGVAIYTYEHFNPPYKDAKVHDPKGITLLCGRCQDKTSRGQLSKQTIAEADAAPVARRKGYSFDVFDVGNVQPVIIVGSVGFRCERAIMIGEATILGAKPPEEPGGPFRLTAMLCNKTSQEILKITDNVWRVPADNWDVQVEGQRITIRNQRSDIALVLRMEPRDLLVVERLRMFYRGALITCSEKAGLYVEPLGFMPLRMSGITLQHTIGIRIPADAF